MTPGATGGGTDSGGVAVGGGVAARGGVPDPWAGTAGGWTRSPHVGASCGRWEPTGCPCGASERPAGDIDAAASCSRVFAAASRDAAAASRVFAAASRDFAAASRAFAAAKKSNAGSDGCPPPFIVAVVSEALSRLALAG
jgi:hypothetical protein